MHLKAITLKKQSNTGGMHHEVKFLAVLYLERALCDMVSLIQT